MPSLKTAALDSYRFTSLCSYQFIDSLFTIRPVQLLAVPMLRLFQSFIAKMKASFQRIARATKNELTVDDLHNDAWVIALDIGDRRGRPIDFSDPEDQELVLGALHVQNVRRGDWNMRRSVRIDQDPDGDDGGATLIDRLPAQASSDPLVSLLLRESALHTDKILAASYSQAAAYVVVFVHFNNDREQVCTYLVISDGTLSRRITVAAETVKAQPSLFDRIECIPSNFMPPPGKQYGAKIEDSREPAQVVWDFGDQTPTPVYPAFLLRKQ